MTLQGIHVRAFYNVDSMYSKGLRIEAVDLFELGFTKKESRAHFLAAAKLVQCEKSLRHTLPVLEYPEKAGPT